MNYETNWIDSCINFSMLREGASEGEKIQGHNAEVQLKALVEDHQRLKAILGEALSRGLISIDGVNLVEENKRLKDNQIPGRCDTCDRYGEDGKCDRICYYMKPQWYCCLYILKDKGNDKA
jgi:hypothetical protein